MKTTGKLSLLVIAMVWWCAKEVSAIDTYSTVYNLLQANCATAGCHGGTNYTIFSVEGSEADVYNRLIGASVNNSAAAAKGYKLVDPGHPYNSFLLKKIGSDFESYLSLEPGEGDRCPSQGQPALEDYEIELVRQWILHGAQQTGDVVNYQLLQDYYTNGGIDFIQPPPAPAPSEGIQVRYGPIFIAPLNDVEWDKKEHLNNDQPIKVYKTDGFMPWQSHHMLLFKFNDDGSGTRDGMRLVPTEAFPFNGNVSLTGAWQNDEEFELPPGTAFFWDSNTVLDFDYHIKNYSSTEILPADFYLNIYFDTKDERNIQMFAQLENNAALFLPQGVQTRTASGDFNEDRYIYMISSHAHQWATDFDIYTKNANGSRGDKIYEGFYSADYTFNQGFYDWEHPPIRYFDPLLKVSHGLEYETTWDVGVPLVTFGLTVDDEMMLFTYLYTKQPIPETPTAIDNQEGKVRKMDVFPNPFSKDAAVSFSLEKTGEVTVEVYTAIGEKLGSLIDQTLAQGTHTFSIDPKMIDHSGLFFIVFNVDGQRVETKKVTKL